MRTHGHAILNLALLDAAGAPSLTPVFWGAIAPDLSITVFYLWVKLVERLPEVRIWGEAYNRPGWQVLVATGHSLPLAFLGMAIAHGQGWLALQWFFLSMVLHDLADVPIHHHDAHRHLFPISNWRFISPLSYWDLRHHAPAVTLVESLVVAIATLALWPAISTLWGHGLLLLCNAIYAWGYWRGYAPWRGTRRSHIRCAAAIESYTQATADS